VKKVRIQVPSYEGLNLERNVVLAFSSTVAAVQEAMEDVQKLGARGNITINIPGEGRVPLDDLSDRLCSPGMVCLFWITWEAALAKRGWTICDGTCGAPPLHPRRGSDDPQRFPVAGPWGHSPSTPSRESTGGTETHHHVLNNIETDPSTMLSEELLTGCGVTASHRDHTHHITADTDGAAHLPPYCEFIFMMKL